MKQFSIKFLVRSSLNENKFLVNEAIETDSMIELLSKLMILVAKADGELHEEFRINQLRQGKWDDDIPF